MTANSHEIPLPDEVEDTLNAWKKKNKQKQKKKEEEKNLRRKNNLHFRLWSSKCQT
jgi:hypothetical protein